MVVVSNDADLPKAVSSEESGGRLGRVLLIGIIIAAFLPEEITFYPFGIRLAISRVLLLIAAPFTVAAFFRLAGSRKYRFLLSDFLVTLAGMWLITAPIAVNGFAVIIKGAALAVDFWVAYWVFRILPIDEITILSVVKTMSMTAATVGFLSLGDPLSGGPLLHKVGAAVMATHIHPNWSSAGDQFYRLGLFRAAGTLEHPIMLGISMVFGLFLSRGLGGWARFYAVAGCATGLLACLSSGPLMAGLVGLALSTYGTIVRWKYRWALLVVIFAVGFVVFVELHHAPFGFLFRYLMLTPQTGFYRLLTWHYAGDAVLGSPVFGLGVLNTDDWPRPKWLVPSVDSMWLRMALETGIPASVLVGLSLISVLRLPIGSYQDAKLARVADGISVGLFGAVLMGFTVDYWGTNWLFLGVLSGLRACLAQLASNRQEALKSTGPPLQLLR